MPLTAIGSKIIIRFEASGGATPTGWSETWYSAQADITVVANQDVLPYVKARAQLLGIGAHVESATVSQYPATRITRVYYFQGSVGYPPSLLQSPQDDYDPTQVDLLLRIEDTSGHRRQLWLGGLPDSQTDQLKAQGMSASFLVGPLMTQYVKAIKTAGWGVRSLYLVGPPKVYTFNPVQYVQPIMIRNRKRGRPFELFHGRRLA